MRTAFKTLGVLGKPSDPRITETLKVLCDFFIPLYDIVLDSESVPALGHSRLRNYPLEELGEHCDVLIAVGGDGTFLSAARAATLHGVPVVGVNLGRLGFLADISPHELPDKLEKVLTGLHVEEERCLLLAKVIRDGRVIHEEMAVNEVVIHRWVTPSMIEIVTKIDNVFLNSQRSDGLIVSTPTGSTAYSLSAGGPIIHPALNALVLVPLNPHTLSNRPIVVNDSSEIEISFCQTKQINAQVTCDHIEIPDVRISDKIVITKYPRPIRILHPQNHDFFQILRTKLNWSGGYPN